MEGVVGRFEKTDAGRQEVAARTGALDRRTRALLIMVDGRTSAEDLLARAKQLGLTSEAVLALRQAGLIQSVGELGHQSDAQPLTEPLPAAAKPKVQIRKQSLAAARMYLMDIVVRTLGTADLPIRTRLIEATDLLSVRQAFEAFLEILRETATPSLVANIEESFREQFPAGDER